MRCNVNPYLTAQWVHCQSLPPGQRVLLLLPSTISAAVAPLCLNVWRASPHSNTARNCLPRAKDRRKRTPAARCRLTGLDTGHSAMQRGRLRHNAGSQLYAQSLPTKQQARVANDNRPPTVTDRTSKARAGTDGPGKAPSTQPPLARVMYCTDNPPVSVARQPTHQQQPHNTNNPPKRHPTLPVSPAVRTYETNPKVSPDVYARATANTTTPAGPRMVRPAR